MAPGDKANQFRNGTANRARFLYGTAVVSCVAMICATWGPQDRAHDIMAFAAMFMFQFWNYLKGDATHATATAAAMESRAARQESSAAKDAAESAEKKADAAVKASAANFAQLKRSTAEVRGDIKAADAAAGERSKSVPGESGAHPVVPPQ